MISFVVPMFGHLEQSKEMLMSLWDTVPAGLDYEVILIDDGSIDGTPVWLSEIKHSKVRVMVNKTNLGYAKTCNRAIKATQGRILGLLNNDLVLQPGWLEPMLEILESPALNAGLVGNVQHRIISGALDAVLDHAGIEVNCDGKLEHVRVLPDLPIACKRVFAVTGACCLVKKEDFTNVGEFDEEFVNGGEDVDLCLKIKEAKKYVYVALQSYVGHHVSLSRDKASLSDELNSRRLQKKWRPEFKREIANCWATKLHAGATDSIDGSLTSSFVTKPHVASRVIAENALLCEESRWQRLFEQNVPSPNLFNRCTSILVKTSGRKVSYGVSELVMTLNVTGLNSARNFFVCGYRTNGANLLVATTFVTVAVTINGIQQKKFVLGRQSNFNFGLVDPLILLGTGNVFQVIVSVHDLETSEPIGDADKCIVITHFVLDDVEILIQQSERNTVVV